MSKRKGDEDENHDSVKKLQLNSVVNGDIISQLPDNVFAQLLGYLTPKEEGRLRRTCLKLYDRVTDISRTFRTTKELTAKQLSQLPDYIVDSDLGLSLSLEMNDLASPQIPKLTQRIIKLPQIPKLTQRIIKLDLTEHGSFIKANVKLAKSMLLSMKNLKELRLAITPNSLKTIAPDLMESLAPSLVKLKIERDKGTMPDFPSFKFSALTHLEVNMNWDGDISQLLINGQNTIKDLTLDLNSSSDPTFIEHMGKLRKLKHLTLCGWSEKEMIYGELPQLLSACSLSSLTLNGLSLEPFAEADLILNLRKLELECCSDIKGVIKLITASSQTLQNLTIQECPDDFSSLEVNLPQLNILKLGSIAFDGLENLLTLKNAKTVIERSGEHLKSIDLTLSYNEANLIMLLKQIPETVECLTINFLTVTLTILNSKLIENEEEVSFPRLQKLEVNIRHGNLKTLESKTLEHLKKFFFGDREVECGGWLGHRRNLFYDDTYNELSVIKKSTVPEEYQKANRKFPSFLIVMRPICGIYP